MSLKNLEGLCPDKDGSEIERIISLFNSSNASKTDFGDVDYFERKTFVEIVEKEAARDKWRPNIAISILNAIRLLSRDAKQLDVIYTKSVGEFILHCAHLPANSKAPAEFKDVVEALKCLVNGLFNSRAMLGYFGPEAHAALLQLLIDMNDKTSQELQCSQEIFDWLYHLSLRILFISTALQEKNTIIWKEGKYLDTIIALLERFAKDLEENLPRKPMDHVVRGNDVLKIIFNCYCRGSEPSDKTCEVILEVVCSILRLKSTVDEDYIQNCINLIFALPVRIDVICPSSESARISFGGKDMAIIQTILNKIESLLIANDFSLLSTYITTLLRYCIASQDVRRYVRLIILPPLSEEDVRRRPDEGETLRNRIVRLMTGTGNCATVSSELMFVLCKRSVSRMIKYTGFGHSAGLLANAGLLGMVNSPKSDENSEDSETEEYTNVESRVNPVTGYIQPHEESSPLDSMSEEQKEYEAMKLVDAMQKMLDTGVITPGVLGEDGNLRPYKHVLEMVEHSEKTRSQNHREEDSDSD